MAYSSRRGGDPLEALVDLSHNYGTEHGAYTGGFQKRGMRRYNKGPYRRRHRGIRFTAGVIAAGLLFATGKYGVEYYSGSSLNASDAGITPTADGGIVVDRNSKGAGLTSAIRENLLRDNKKEGLPENYDALDGAYRVKFTLGQTCVSQTMSQEAVAVNGTTHPEYKFGSIDVCFSEDDTTISSDGTAIQSMKVRLQVNDFEEFKKRAKKRATDLDSTIESATDFEDAFSDEGVGGAVIGYVSGTASGVCPSYHSVIVQAAERRHNIKPEIVATGVLAATPDAQAVSMVWQGNDTEGAAYACQ